MFKRLKTSDEKDIILDFEGTPVSARTGDTVAAALLAAGITVFRQTPLSGQPRGPFCMMGVCFECLMIIDGQSNHQACQTIVRDGMKIARQQGAALVEPKSGA